MKSSKTFSNPRTTIPESNPNVELARVANRIVYWCETCGVPLLSNQCGNCGNTGRRIAADLKPVFEDERRYIATHTGEQSLLDLPLPLLWMRQRIIYYDGHPYMHLSGDGKLSTVKKYELRSSPMPARLPTDETLRTANESALRELENEAIRFIQQVVADYPQRLPIVSFSGGKDSAVVSFLVRKALKTDKVLHIFGDTTIEYPDTYRYVTQFRSKNPYIPFAVPRCEQDWFTMCDALEPPSRILRWCCTVFKASPIGKVLNQANGEHGAISFEGLKRCESNLRRKAKRIYQSKKIAKQISAEPILDWSDLAVWLYILTNRIPFNAAYRKGFARVGCLYCPYNTLSSEHLMQEMYPLEVQKWEQYLIAHARALGKANPTEYVSSGAWKTRAGTNGSFSGNSLQRNPGACGGEIENNYLLSKPVTATLLDFFRPLGVLSPISHPDLGIFIVRDFVSREPLFRFQAIQGWSRLSTTMLISKGSYLLRQRIERQIKKFQSCIGCGGCVGVCPTGALQVNPVMTIDDKKCIRCLRCSTYTDRGCIALGSLKRRNSIEDLV